MLSRSFALLNLNLLLVIVVVVPPPAMQGGSVVVDAGFMYATQKSDSAYTTGSSSNTSRVPMTGGLWSLKYGFKV